MPTAGKTIGDMNIKVHRGLEQIGGCITDIWTDTSRVFIDFGQNLPGHGEPTTPEEDSRMVNDIINNNMKEHQAVFYTHAHGDHVGLFGHIDLDRYISEGSKELLLIKYGILKGACEKERDAYSQRQKKDSQQEEILEQKYASATGLV